MKREEYEKLYNFENFYWWHIGRREIIKSFLEKFLKNRKNQILEIGCGTGGNLKIFSEFGNAAGLDNSMEALDYCKKRGFTNLIFTKAEETNLQSESFDLVAAPDVLEHIQDDNKTLKEVRRILKNEGLFLATVPAYQFLWSQHDELAHHKRRYSMPEIREKFKDAGFEIKKISHIVFFVFPAILFYRAVERIFFPKSKKNTAYIVLPQWLNTLFIVLLKFESLLLKYINLPFGTSIIIIAKKR